MFLINENDFGMPDNSTDVHIEDGDWKNLSTYDYQDLTGLFWFHKMAYFLCPSCEKISMIADAIKRNEMMITIRHPRLIMDRVFGSLMQPFLSSQFVKFTGTSPASLPNDLPAVFVNPNMRVDIGETRSKRITELRIIIEIEDASEMVKACFDLNELNDTDIDIIGESLKKKIKEKQSDYQRN